MKIHLSLVLCISLIIIDCGSRSSPVSVRGTITDQKTGKPIAGAHVYDSSAEDHVASSNTDGEFILHGVVKNHHPIFVEAEQYRRQKFIVPTAYEDSVFTRDIQLMRIPDTAYTVRGPVDASFFLSDSLLKRKRLSKNEAKRFALQEITGGRVIGAEMIRDRGQLLWVFDVKHGRDVISVTIDAYTGKVLSSDNDKVNHGKRKEKVIDDE